MAIYLKRVKSERSCQGCYFLNKSHCCIRYEKLGFERWRKEPTCTDFIYIQIEKPEEKQ